MNQLWAKSNWVVLTWMQSIRSPFKNKYASWNRLSAKKQETNAVTVKNRSKTGKKQSFSNLVSAFTQCIKSVLRRIQRQLYWKIKICTAPSAVNKLVPSSKDNIWAKSNWSRLSKVRCKNSWAPLQTSKSARVVRWWRLLKARSTIIQRTILVK